MILCCGEALVDMIPSEKPDGRSCFVPHPGGAVFNTAIALGRPGVNASLLTGLSTDLFGTQLRRTPAESNVNATSAASTDRPTPLAFVTLSNSRASYGFIDENSAVSMLSIAEIPKPDSRIECLFLGGISLAGDPCGEALESLLDREGNTR